MKTRLVFLVLLIVCYSCEKNNKPPSDADKEKIKGEVKEEVNTFFKGCEEVNLDMAMKPMLDSPDFAYINNGYAFSYKECMDIFRPVFNTFLNQKITILDEKYSFPDNATVLYSNHCTCLTNYKDGHSVLQDPTVMLFIFKKIDDAWKVIYGVESHIDKNVPNESLKALNQIELMKQNIGSWKCNIAKDTTATWDAKSFGTGLEGYNKYSTNGKLFKEGKGLYGYDKNIDKFIVAGLTKGEDIGIYALWFTTDRKYVLVPYSDLSNPANASFRLEGEFKSPDMIVETTIMNNKSVRTDTWTRVK